MKVLLTGSSGTGKTTILNELVKINSNLKPITEVVRRLVKSEGLVINEAGRTATQKRVFDTYVEELEQDNYISDRCLIDVLGYSLANFDLMDGDDPEWLEFRDEVYREIDVVEEWFKNHEYYVIYFPIEFETVDDGVRSTNEEYRKYTDYCMKEVIDKLGIDYLTVHGTKEERIEQIKAYIANK